MTWEFCIRVLLLLILPTVASATVFPSVGSAGSAVYRGTDSGNTATNGTNFRDTIAAASYGDTIVLPAGVVFSTGTTSNSVFNFPVKTGTGWITIQSSRAAELPDGVRVSPSDTAKMATLEANGGGGTAAQFPGGSHHWKFEGILFTSGSNINSANTIVNYLAGDDKTTATIRAWPHHIWFDRCVFRPYEYAAGASDPFRSVSYAVSIEGEEIWATNSYFYEFGGARTDYTARSVSGISESTTPVMTASSLNGHPAGDALNTWISGATGWWARFNGSNFCYPLTSTTCELSKAGLYVVVSSSVAKYQMYLKVPHGFQTGDTVTISGFPVSGTGSDFNGAKTITVTSDWEFTFSTSESDGIYCVGGNSCQFQLSGTRILAKLDTTGQGSLTGTVTHRELQLHNSYAILVVAAPGPVRAHNNFMMAQFSAIFLGGGGSATAYSATISDPAANGATFSNTAGLRIGEIVAIQTDYTGYLSGWKTVKIDTINPSTGAVTWTPWGQIGLRSTAATTTSGTCTTSGTSVTTSWYVPYQSVYSGVPININGTGYTVSVLNSTSSLTLTGSAGTQTDVSCSLAMLPKDGGTVRWRGVPGTTVYANRNEFTVASYGLTIGGICKGAHELKIEVGGIWNGNTYTGKSCVPWGLTQRNQAGSTPWSTLGRTQYTNNLILQSDRVWVLLLDDDLATTVREEQSPGGYGGGNMLFRNNLILGDSTDSYGNVVSDYIGALTGDSSAYVHNSILKPHTTITGIVNGPTYSPSLIPPYGLQTGVYESNIYADYGYGWNTGSAYPTKTTNVKRNIIAGNGTAQGTIDGDVPGNLYAADLAAIGLVGTCNNSGTNWKNCKLDPGATHAGAGENGSDPGADPVVIEDHVNGWSVDAGLQERDNNALRPQQIGSTRAAISFRLRNSTAANCTLVLYTDADYRTEHGDTDTSGEKACNRSGNAVNGDMVTFVLGTNTALTASTAYYFEITDGSRKMRWALRTLASGSGESYTWSRAMECGNDGATFGTAVSAGTAYAISAGAVRYCREVLPVGNTMVLVAN